MNGVSVSEDEEGRGQKVNTGQIGIPEQFSGKEDKTEIYTISSKNKSRR